MIIKKFILIIFVFACIGCSTTTKTFNVIKPIYPDIINVGGAMYARIDTLQPLFKWEPWPEANTIYDIIIYDSIVIRENMGILTTEIGKVVYQRQDLKYPQHLVEEPLKPNTLYYWSIRYRYGDKVSEWSTVTYNSTSLCILPGAVVEQKSRAANIYFRFQTPTK